MQAQLAADRDRHATELKKLQDQITSIREEAATALAEAEKKAAADATEKSRAAGERELAAERERMATVGSIYRSNILSPI